MSPPVGAARSGVVGARVGDAIPDSVVDHFEDGDVTEWTDVDGGSISATSSNVFAGSWAGQVSGTGSGYVGGAIYDPSVVDTSNLTSITVTAYVRESAGDDICGIILADSTNTDTRFFTDFTSQFDQFELYEMVDGSETVIDNTTGVGSFVGEYHKMDLTYNFSTNAVESNYYDVSDNVLYTDSATSTALTPDCGGVMTYRGSPNVDDFEVTYS